jgi:hypothetical protein
MRITALYSFDCGRNGTCPKSSKLPHYLRSTDE